MEVAVHLDTLFGVLQSPINKKMCSILIEIIFFNQECNPTFSIAVLNLTDHFFVDRSLCLSCANSVYAVLYFEYHKYVYIVLGCQPSSSFSQSEHHC